MNMNEKVDEEVHFEYQNNQWSLSGGGCGKSFNNGLSFILWRTPVPKCPLTQLDQQKTVTHLLILAFIQWANH